MEWSISLLRHFKIQTLLKINCCMATISAFRVTQHSQIFSLFSRNRIQCIALYQLYNSQALLNLDMFGMLKRTHRRDILASSESCSEQSELLEKLLNSGLQCSYSMISAFNVKHSDFVNCFLNKFVSKWVNQSIKRF